MRRYSKFVVVAGAVAALAAPSAAMAAANPGNGSTNCPNAAQGTTSYPDGAVISSNLNVPAGVTCRLGWVEVQGNVSATGNLYTFGQAHFDKNVTVNPGGSFAASNWGVTIDQNLYITDPAANSGNGFWGDYSSNVVKGSVNYTITPAAAAAYPQYQWPYLYFGGGTTVQNLSYSVGSLSSVRPFDSHVTNGLKVLGSTTVS
jgi:hypothetical protein